MNAPHLLSLVPGELDRVLAAPAFAGARGQQRLLRHLVEHTLSGNTAVLKETVLGIEVFGRREDRFDPDSDSIVRVEARRLRQRLARHYASAGRDAPVEIVLPVGGYVPQFRGSAPPRDDLPRGQASELVERGHFFMRQGSEAGYRKALVRYSEAARLDPRLPDAHMGVARAWSGLVGMMFEPSQPGVHHARQAAERALGLDPRRGDALALLAGLIHRFEFDWRGAEALFRRAIVIDPGSAFLHHSLAFSMMLVGRFDEAERELQVAHGIEPLELSLRSHEALLQFYRRDWAGAERHLLALLDLVPDSLLGRSLLGAVHLNRGEAAHALALYQAVRDEQPLVSIGWIGVAQAEALGGNAAAARDTLVRLRERFEGRELSPYQLALVAVRLGDTDDALALLDQAGAARDCNFFCALVDPGLETLRSDPRLAALLTCHGLIGTQAS